MSGVELQAGGPGARLGAARRQAGLHIAALATQLKVPVTRLEALEAERWDALPDATHARALATSVCRVLGLDPAPVLAGMPRAAGVALDRVSAGLNQPVRDGAAWQAPRAWVWAMAALLLVLAAGLALWPRDRGLGEALNSLMAASSPTPPASVDAPAAQPASLPESALPTAGRAGAATEAALAAVASSAPEPGTASQPALATPADGVRLALPVASAATSATTATTATTALGGAAHLELEAFAGASWVSVVDAKGQSLAARLLVRGERLSLESAALPLRVVLGNAPALRLNWRGQSQALDGLTAARVARLELK